MNGYCQICGKESGIYPLCPNCSLLVETGEIKECPDCKKWHYSNKECHCKEENKITQEEQYKPIICPHCKGSNLAFITEYHKSIGFRIVEIIALVILIITSISFITSQISIISTENTQTVTQELNEYLGATPPVCTKSDNDEDNGLFLLVFFCLTWISAHAARLYIESKTNIQCICKDCGKTWLYNNGT